MTHLVARAASAALTVICALSLQARADEPDGAQSLLEHESPELFLAKATLQQYLSRIVRKDWEGARRLTHPKALAQLERMKARIGQERSNLAPWADATTQRQAFRFLGARELLPGVVVIGTGEDNFHTEEQGVSSDDPAVYVLFRVQGNWLVGDKKDGMGLDDLTEDAVRAGYPGWSGTQQTAQARRPERRRR